MKDLRLLQIVPSLESGGVEQGTIDVANYVADKGFCSIIASSGGRMLNLLHRKNIQHIYLPAQAKNPFVIFNNVKRIENIIKKNKINIVHVRSRAPAWSLHFAAKYGCTTVSTFHNIYGHQNFFKKYYNKALSKVDKIVAISEYVKSSISSIYNINDEKIVVINRGIDTDFFNPELNDEKKYLEFYTKYNLPNKKKIILYPGRLTNWKGQIEFLEIIQSLDLNIVICYYVGDEKNISYTTKLNNEIIRKNLGSVCKILGHISKEDLRLMYKSADVIISAPLKPEGFGRIISEGLAMKKIVLCSNFGGAKEQITGLDSLFSVKPENKSEMIEKINIVFELSKEKRKQIGEIARNHVTKKFSKEIMLKNYLKFYQENI